MIDERFARYDAIEKLRLEAISKGRTVESEAWFSQTVECLSVWYIEAMQGSIPEQDQFDAIPPDEDLRSRLGAVAELPAQTVEQITTWRATRPQHEQDPQIAWIWGCGLARVAVRLGDKPEALPFALSQMAHQFTAVDAFLNELAATIGSQSASPISQAIRTLAADIRNLTDCRSGLQSPDQVRAIIDAWWARAHLDDCWDGANWQGFRLDCPSAVLLDAVRRSDKGEYLRLLEEMRNIWLANSAFSRPDVKHDVEEMLALLAVAPSVWTGQNGQPGAGEWTGAFTALLVLSTLVDHVAELDHLIAVAPNVLGLSPQQAKVDREQLLSTDVVQICDRAVDVALKRQDGAQLCTHWLAHLVHDLEGIDPSVVTPTLVAFCNALARAMATHGISIESFRPAFPEAFVATAKSGPSDVLPPSDNVGSASLHEIDAILAALAVSSCADDVESARAAVGTLAPIFVRSLQQRDEGLSLFRNPGISARHAYAAALVLLGSDPITSWNSLWDSLAEQRLRFISQHYRHDATNESPSLFVISTGAAAITLMCSDPHRDGSQILRLWNRLYDAALSIVTRQQCNSELGNWRAVLVHLHSLLPMVLGRCPAGSSAEMLVDSVRRLGGDDYLIVASAAALSVAGLGAAEVVGAVTGAGGDLAASVERYVDSCEVMQPAHYGAESLPDSVRRLIREAAEGALVSDAPRGGD